MESMVLGSGAVRCYKRLLGGACLWTAVTGLGKAGYAAAVWQWVTYLGLNAETSGSSDVSVPTSLSQSSVSEVEE